MRYLKALERAENKKEPDKAQEVVEVTEVEVEVEANEEEEEWMTEEEQQQVDEGATWTWNMFARVRRKK